MIVLRILLLAFEFNDKLVRTLLANDYTHKAHDRC